MADRELRLRADAQVNRNRILEVARESLAADPAVSLNAVAKLAGVGAGTLYRHFPNREALVVGVYRKEVDDLVALGPALLCKHAPLKAFRTWCDRLAKTARTKQVIAALLEGVLTDQDRQESYVPMLEAVGQLLTACIQSGDVRSGLDAADFLALVSFLWKLPPSAEGEARAKRLLAFVFEAMGARDVEST